MGIITKALARLFGRHRTDNGVTTGEPAQILIREADRLLSGRELFREVSEKNAAEAAADLKAFHERVEQKMMGS